MINPFAEVNWRPDRKACRDFAKSWTLGFPILASLLATLVRWKTGEWAVWPWWLGVAGFGIGTICWARPSLARPVYLIWYGIGGLMGFVVSNLFLAATFYLVVTPIGMVLRLWGKDPLERQLDRSASSYWKDAEKTGSAKDYFRQF